MTFLRSTLWVIILVATHLLHGQTKQNISLQPSAWTAEPGSELTFETFGSLATHGTAVTQGSTVSLRSARPPAEGPAAPEKPGFLARARRFFRRKS